MVNTIFSKKCVFSFHQLSNISAFLFNMSYSLSVVKSTVQHQVRIAGEGTGEREATLLAERELVGEAVRVGR